MHIRLPAQFFWKNTGVQLYSNVQHIDVTFQYISVCSVLELGHTPEERGVISCMK